MRQLKLAFRTLWKSPFVTGIAILSLALGIGANAAIFSLFDQILLQPLPVRDPGQLVNLSAPGPKPGSQSCGEAGDCEDVFSYAMFRDLEKSQTPLSGLAAHVTFGVNLSFRDQPLDGDGLFVSGSYFPTLGIRPQIGRLLTPDDDQNIGGHFVTVLGNGFWRSHLGSDPSVVGQVITINGQSMTIVGVTPDGFEGTTLGVRPDVYVPLTMRAVLQNSDGKFFTERRNYFAYLFGRLKPGVTIDQAKRALNATYSPIINDVEVPLQKGMSEVTLAKFKKKELGVEAGQRGQSGIHREAKTPLLLLFGITGIVLLIACANIANLLLARGANRGMEMGVRLALGASRRQLLGQLLTESVLLALMGGAASLVFAQWTLGGIQRLLPMDALPTLHFSLQPAVLVFAAGLSVLTGLLFGMFPALHSTRGDLVTAIRANAGQISGARAAARFRATLVSVQIALSMALLISAGLFMKSLVNVSHVDLGLHVDSVVRFGIAPLRSGYDTLRAAVLFQRVENELRAIPGVTAVTDSRVPLLAGSNWGTGVKVQGFKSGPDIDNGARYNEVGAGYFSALGIRMLQGREFTEADVADGAKVAVVNERFVEKFGLGKDVIGKYMSMNGSDTLNMQIVGLIKDAKYSSVKDSVPALFYTPWRQDRGVGSLSFYVRTSSSPGQLLRTIPGVLKRIDPALPVTNLKTMPQQIRDNTFLDRMISILSAAFAVLATLLAGVGLYGVLAYTVAQRTREIGVRMALGANSGNVRLMVMRQVGVMVLAGGVVGIIGAWGLGKAASSLLYGLQGYDPPVFIMSTVVLALVAFSAGYLPARRASQVDPIKALRYE